MNIEPARGVTPAPTPMEVAVKAATVLLERGGWELREVDIDLVAGTARVSVRSHAGRVVTLFADQQGRRCYLERCQERTEWVRRGAGGALFKGGGRSLSASEETVTDFLGRERCEGIRSGARALCVYLTDNAPRPLALADARRAFGGILQAATPRPMLERGEDEPPRMDRGEEPPRGQGDVNEDAQGADGWRREHHPGRRAQGRPTQPRTGVVQGRAAVR